VKYKTGHKQVNQFLHGKKSIDQGKKAYTRAVFYKGERLRRKKLAFSSVLVATDP